ncbi:outer envelope membrane protein 7 [Ziziphus jujuba]|nr:outer envelope membrane protein 7 [Ziziphus jujuba]
MGAITAAVIAIAGVVVGWITIEIACKPCLEKGREAIDHSLNPDYDPDDAPTTIRAPLYPNPNPSPDLHEPTHNHPNPPLVSSSTSHDVIKAV